MYSLYIYFIRLQYHAYMPCICPYIAINTLVHTKQAAYINIHICSARPQNTIHKPLAL